MYIFWDNSNIHYAGLNSVLPIKEPNAQRELYRTYFDGLLKLVQQDRNIDDVFFAGSVPPKEDNLWNVLRSLGIQPALLPRSISDGEADSTDHVLQLALLRLVMDVPTPGVIAILTGDGSGIRSGQGFLADAIRASARGWQFEIYSWDIACHAQLRAFAETNGKYYKLEDYYENITFLKGVRMPIPLQNQGTP